MTEYRLFMAYSFTSMWIFCFIKSQTTIHQEISIYSLYECVIDI